MPKVQIGTTFLPIKLTPRVKGQAVKVSDIKSTYSQKFVDNASTPLDFFLEYEARGVAPTAIAWDPASSTDSVINFLVPDALYATEMTYTVIFYWTVKSLSVVVEQIFTENSMILEVLDLHNNPG